jgi:hypothetical protein
MFQSLRNRLTLFMLIAILVVGSAVPTFAQETETGFTMPPINLAAFFNAFGNYVGTFIEIFAPIGAIGAALVFVWWIIGKMTAAFGGKGLK